MDNPSLKDPLCKKFAEKMVDVKLEKSMVEIRSGMIFIKGFL